MLKELYIENLAVIEKMNINFELGLTCFTGETGAGKSILIDAINLVLGQRSSKDIVRTNEKKAVVIAVFDEITENLKTKLLDYGYEVNDQLIISREITKEGKSSARICSQPVVVSVLKDIGSELINIHGQYDSQILLQSEHHIDILDSFATNKNLIDEYNEEYNKYINIKKRYQKLVLEEKTKSDKIDMLSYQLNELNDIKLQDSEDILLEEKLQQMENASKISESLTSAYALLYGYDDEQSGYDIISEASDNIEQIQDYSKTLATMSQGIQAIKYGVSEIIEQISDFIDNFDFDVSDFEYSQQRLAQIQAIKRKYGNIIPLKKDVLASEITVNDIIEYQKNIAKELKAIQMTEQTKEEILQEREVQKHIAMDLADKISENRKMYGAIFENKVAEELRFLDMPNVILKVDINKSKYNATGCDNVEFLFSTNKGESLKSISKIASGGELSRIMLAIKSTMAEKDEIDTLIFDEIDAGVSGQSAQKIGKKLKEISSKRQVLCVTHSAQIAALAHNNFMLKKEVKEDRTYTRIIPLTEEEKINEVARIMGTDTITALTLENAREMIENAKNLT